ncbi:hypothetical protein JCM11491_003442 [Sporobolomyces phaffii]
MNDSIPYSPHLSSPQTPWSDAHSTFGNSPYLDSSRAGSSTSLWTASSASSIAEIDLDEDVSSELKCLELLAEFEREKRRKSADEKRDHLGGGGYLHSRDESLPDVVQPLDVNKARAARFAKYPNESHSSAAAPSSTVCSPSTHKTRRLSRRASFTTTDLAELDIDAILDAYTSEALATAPLAYNQDTLPCRPLPRSKNSFNLQREVYPSPQGPLPPRPAALDRRDTAYSIRSTRSSQSNGSAATAADRRAGPFPTITRQRSNGSLASRKLPFDAAAAPPLPSAPPFPTSVPMSNRTFSSFSRQSMASTASSSSAHSLPLRSVPTSSRASCASSTMSRQTSSTSAQNSFRWSVATSSTVPTLVSDGSSDCGASRRGSLAPSSVGSFKQSPSRSRRRPSAPFPGSPIEQEEDDDRFWGSRRKDSLAEDDDDDDDDAQEAGLISWEDFADELASLPVPNRPTPRRLNSQGSSTSSSRSRNGSTASAFPSKHVQQPIFASPEPLRSTATLTSLSSSNSSKPASPFPTSSPATSPTLNRAGKKGLLQGLRSKKSTRDLVSAYA